jgi:ectoine hydroxylase-related dioxygenase (phytanoyl-CoA dioxygenase family)
MDPACLKHALTDEERRTFETTGLLVLENVLEPARVAALEGATDRLFARRVAEGHGAQEPLLYSNFIPDDAAFAALVDYEKILPKVWGLLGWNIYLYHAHLVVTPPSGKTPDEATFGWHQDSGRVNVEIESHPRPRLSLKVGYFLSDTSEVGRGNFWVVPTSHLRDTLERPADGVGQPAGAEPVRVRPGSAVFFDRRLWHAASPNWSAITRKVLFYGYGYRWIRTKDDMTVSTLWESSDPIRRQMLGWGVNANGFYSPTDADVPLRVWLREHSPNDA